jgi:hypothetical protein
MHVRTASNGLGYTLHAHTAGAGRVTSWTFILLMFVMPECRNAKTISSASAFSPVANCLSPASAFRHQGQSGTAGHG